MAWVYQSALCRLTNGDVSNLYVLNGNTLFAMASTNQCMKLIQGSWMIQKFWAPSAAFVKISIVVFLKRLLGTVRAYAIISNILIGFIACWAVTALLVNIFQCTPVQYYYDKDLNGHCMSGQRAFFQAMGAFSLVEDVIVLCLPTPIVWGLQITFRQKIAVTLVFSLGGLYVILWSVFEFRR